MAKFNNVTPPRFSNAFPNGPVKTEFTGNSDSGIQLPYRFP